MLTNTIGMRLRNLEASDLPKDDEILSNLIIRLKKCLEDDKRRPADCEIPSFMASELTVEVAKEKDDYCMGTYDSCYFMVT
ncbi:MAG: hypothetical protein WC906_02185 [Parcubacteria group bacterium]|jgi:hypothetical protein